MRTIKKVYKIYFLLLAAAVAVTGCTKNLEQAPQSTATRDAVFGSADGLQLYANSFYNILPAIGSDGNSVYKVDANLSDFGARNGVPDYIRTGVWNSRQSTGWSWGNLRSLNYFIANCTNPAVAKPVRENYIGLARFFRAYFYYTMVQKFGNVPWISKPLAVTDSALLYAPRDPRTLVMDSVLADLNYAISHITLLTDNTRSQITKWVAYGLKSRICLFEGTFRRYQTSYGLTATAAQWLQDAASASKAVMDSAGMSLNTSNGTDLSYRTLFINATPVTNEVMLSDVTSSALAVVNDANWWYTSATYGVRFSFTRTFVNTYLNIDGTPFTSIPGYDTLPFNKETLNRDKRLQQTIRTPGYTRINGGVVAQAPGGDPGAVCPHGIPLSGAQPGNRAEPRPVGAVPQGDPALGRSGHIAGLEQADLHPARVAGIDGEVHAVGRHGGTERGRQIAGGAHGSNSRQSIR